MHYMRKMTRYVERDLSPQRKVAKGFLRLDATLVQCFLHQDR